ncbi:MAG: flavodoxin domain-containing protein [Candidatus Omnitrophica bacterium]|nr:flavodoxin domain-containing protein [Candidatus Omnitrophota bacterium]
MIEIKKDTYWVGAIDWELRNFHGYSTPTGSTYNAYLIVDEKPTLIDTVKDYGFEEMASRIKAIIDPLKIQYIISNHTEMDHSGSIEKMLQLCPNAEIVCSPNGEKGLKRHFKKDWKFKVVNTGDELKIGSRTLKFFLMPMVHWPDSMATYSTDDEILFPNDAFGQHHASAERYAAEVGEDIVFEAAAKYYANIVMPYGAQVLKVLEALKTLKLEMICPSHGLIWKKEENIKQILTLYKKWASYESDKRAVIIYDTMWHSTEKIAFELSELLDKENIPVVRFNLQNADYSDAITEVMRSKVVLLGSAILNNRILPSMGGFLTYLKGLKPKNRFALSFGSYGWSKVGFKDLEEGLKEAGMQLIGDGSYMQFVPDESEIEGLKSTVSKIKELISG